MTVRSASGSAAAGVSVIHETLWSTDPRVAANNGGVGVDPTATVDCTTALQAWANLACTNRAKGGTSDAFLVPGVYKKSGQISFATSQVGFRLRGAGNNGFGGDTSQSGSVLWDYVDAGAGKYSVANTTGTAPFFIDNIACVGSLNPPASKGGTYGYLMRGILANTECVLTSVSASGYAAGLGVSGDHMTLFWCTFNGNDYGLEWLPLPTTQGDIHLYVVSANACSKAAIAVASSSSISGVSGRDFIAGDCPYVILRYPDGQGQDKTDAWINGLDLLNVSTEFTGNGIVYDGVQNGARIRGVTNFDHGTGGNFNLYTGNHWTPASAAGQIGEPGVAAWFNGGPVLNVVFTNSLPTFGPLRPAVLATDITNVRTREGGGLPGDFVSAPGSQMLGIIAGHSSTLAGCDIGRESATLVIPYPCSGTVSRGYCLTSNGANDVIQYAGPGTSPARVKRVRGIALDNCVSGGIAYGCARSNDGNVSVMNTSGATIPADTLIVPDPGGGVAAHGSGVNYGASGQVIGRMINSCTPLLSPPGAPTLAAAAGAGLGIGTYLYKITFVNTQGETTGGTEATVTTTSGNQQVGLSAIPTGGTGTTKRNIYRTVVGGASGSEKLVATLNDNTTTTYTDSIADGSLGTAVPTVNTSGLGAAELSISP